MSLLIKGMDLPHNCWTSCCPCANLEHAYCQADPENRTIYGDVPNWCPLTAIPTHGRLVDADKLALKFAEATQEFKNGYDFERLLRNAPTVIEGDSEK